MGSGAAEDRIRKWALLNSWAPEQGQWEGRGEEQGQGQGCSDAEMEGRIELLAPLITPST